jgi:hypothetical protein
MPPNTVRIIRAEGLVVSAHGSSGDCNPAFFSVIRSTRRSSWLVERASRSSLVPTRHLTEAQRQSFARFDGEPLPDQLARYFHPDGTDQEIHADLRGVRIPTLPPTYSDLIPPTIPS